MNPLIDHLLHGGETFVGLLIFLAGLGIRFLIVLRRIDRRTLLLGLEHEALMKDYISRHPEYERPAAALAKAQRLGL